MALAEFSQTLENAHAMNPRNRVGRSAAALVLAAFSWAMVLSVAPRWHERIHTDANRVEHSCAVTFIAAGNCEYPAKAPLAVEPALLVACEQVALPAQSWVPSPFLSARMLEHAPPAHS